jgi:hypothetical protein
MTDYEKLKAFAEELNPENERGISNLTYEYKNDTVVFYYSAGNISIFNDDGELGIDQNSEYGYGSTLNLDKWINETREYWRGKGLPSLQKNTLTNCSQTYADSVVKEFLTIKGKLYTMPDLSGESFDVQRRHSDNIKGKLYEMPDTVVHLKTQGEYDEYMQMCEDVGWKASYSGIYNYNNDFPLYEINDFYRYNGSLVGIEKEISLQELKERIGVQPTTFRQIQIAHDNWQEQAQRILGGHYPLGDLGGVAVEAIFDAQTEINKTNAGNTATKIMNNIKNTAKRLLLSEPEKTYVKAGLMDIDKNWGSEAKDTAYDQMLADYMDTKKFKDQMTEVAKAIIEEN